MSEIPEDVRESANKLCPCYGADRYCRHEDDNSCEDGCEWSDTIARAIMAERERWKPAATYFDRYCQDEAEDVEHCVCGEQQHEDAKAFATAIRSHPQQGDVK